MSSRDFGFLTLRNMTAYQPNGARVPTNYILNVDSNGLAVFTDSISPCTINVCTINAQTINVSSISTVTHISTLITSSVITSTLFASTAYVTNLSTCDIYCADVLTISSFNQTYLGAKQFEYRSADPSTIGTFKVELYGSNLNVYKSTINSVPGTLLQNNGGGQLALGTNSTIMFLNGATNGNNNVGIGTSNPAAPLHVINNTYTYSQTGSQNITVPSNATSMDFELVGGGGSSLLNLGGSGGYIKGRVNVTAFQGQTITIVVGVAGITGASGSDPSFCSGASYIYKSATALFVMGGGGGGGSSAGTPQQGGYGGGGSFTNPSGTNWIAVGGDGQTAGGGVGGQGGQTGGGGAKGSCSTADGVPGNGRPIIEDYQQALGGNNGGLGTVPGGSGYTGGGSGCAAGGGSSYYNSAYTYVTLTYAGNAIPGTVLPGYGRQGQGGYVSITFNTDSTTILTNGNIVSNALSTLRMYDINGSSGTSGQVLTAGTGGKVVWGNSSGPITTTISTTGLYTLSSYVSPSVRFVRLVAEACGGGGGGGYGNGGNVNLKYGGGGGGSGYLSVFESLFSTISQLNITVGNGGTGTIIGLPYTNPTDGGSTIVANIVPGVDPSILATSTIFIGVGGGKAGGIGTGGGGDGYFGGGGGAANDGPAPGAGGGVGFISPAYDGQQGDAGVGYPPGTGKAGSGGGSYIYNGGINTAAAGAAGGGGGGPMGGAGGGYANGNYYSTSNGLFGGGGGGALWLGDSGSFGNSGNGGNGYVILTMYPL